MKTFLILIGLFCILPRWGFAEPPFIVTESAIPVHPNKYRAEASLQFQEFQQGRRHNNLSFSLAYGLIHNLEVKAAWPYLFSKQNARHQDQLGDLNFAAKVLFLKGRDASPISLAGGVQLKVPSVSQNAIVDTTGEADTRLSLMATKAIAPYKAHLNLAHTYVGNPPKEDRPDRRDYALGVEYTQAHNLSFMGELFGATNISGLSNNEQWSLAGGASYKIHPDMGLDSAVAFGLSNKAPDFILHFRIRYFF